VDGGATWSDVTPNVTRAAGDGGTYWAGQLFIDGGRTWAEQALALPAGYENAQASPGAPVFFSAQDGVLAVGLFRHESARAF